MAHTRFTRQINPLSVALLGVVAAIISYQAAAFRSVPDPQQPPMRIATFDLERTFATLDERTAAGAELSRMAEGMKKETEAKSKALKTMEAELNDLQPGTVKYKDLMENLTLKTFEYQGDVEFFKAKLDIERARLMKRVYMSIRHEAEKLAKERGYVAVLVDDSIAPIPPGTEEEINRQISARRMVYTAPEIDVTDELISRMNNAFKMAGPAPANAPANAPAKP